MDFMHKVFALLEKPFTYIVGVITTSLGLAFDNGLVDTYTIAFVIINISIFTDFTLGFLNALINPKRKVQSKKMGDTVTKMTAIYFSFFSLAIFSLLTYQTSFSLFSSVIHWCVLFLTVLVVTREIISLLETAEDMGLPGAKQIKDKIDSIPNLFNKKQ
ncbi:phage holin family protein [Virgibacillus dakarensis]|nr:phage holin family protein [Virgibacillus dakarensis]